MPQQVLTALPVYNEATHVQAVLQQVRPYSEEILLVDDGSTDGTAELLDAEQGIHVVHHPQNRGYGSALKTAFEFAQQGGYEVLVTIDCDGQHEPQRIPRFVAAAADADIVSGSRYLKRYQGDSAAPEDRRRINHTITQKLKRRLGLNLTDSFCGFKAYRVEALSRLHLTEPGYAMPLELWVQAAFVGLTVLELPVPLIYLDEKRSFGGALDDADRRFRYYCEVLDRAVTALGPEAVERFGRTLCQDLAG